METKYRTEKIEREEMTQAEIEYIGLFGGECWECVCEAPDGHLDTAFGNSEQDAIDRAFKAGCKPIEVKQ
jgi:hypothetical protein